MACSHLCIFKTIYAAICSFLPTHMPFVRKRLSLTSFINSIVFSLFIVLWLLVFLPTVTGEICYIHEPWYFRNCLISSLSDSPQSFCNSLIFEVLMPNSLHKYSAVFPSWRNIAVWITHHIPLSKSEIRFGIRATPCYTYRKALAFLLRAVQNCIASNDNLNMTPF